MSCLNFPDGIVNDHRTAASWSVFVCIILLCSLAWALAMIDPSLQVCTRMEFDECAHTVTDILHTDFKAGTETTA
jgi:hypothetical protein